MTEPERETAVREKQAVAPERHCPARVAVTGAAGNIGRALTEHLRARRYPLTLIDLPSSGLLAGAPGEAVVERDLAEPSSAELFAGCEVVVHLAADPNAHANWESLLPANIVASYNVAAAAMEAGCRRLIMASSVHAVRAATRRPVRPEDAVAPANLYGVSKCFVEALAFWSAHSSAMSAAAVRIGAYQTPEDAQASNAGWMADLFIASSDLMSLLERAISAEYQFALLHAGAPGEDVLLDTAGTEDLLGWRAEHRFPDR